VTDPARTPGADEPGSIAEVVRAEGGQVTFARFMQLALTHPTLGYYSRADRLLRHGGDFSTAPALSPFFNRTVARLVTELVDAAVGAEQDCAEERGAEERGAAENGAREGPRLSVVELGGGEGQLAVAILAFWQAERPDLLRRVAYRIVEVGGRLQQRQAEAVATFAARGAKVGWGTTLAEAWAGTRPVVVVANEFVDTVPVHLVCVAGEELTEAHVRSTATGGLELIWGPPTQPAAGEVELLFGTRDPKRLRALSADGVIEVFPRLGELMREVAAAMPAGSFVNVDYGQWFPGVPRAGGRWDLEDRALRRQSVRGYFTHQLVPDPLARPGRQDLTADVDFAALDLHGRREGFETVLFTTLAAFLRAGGAAEELEALAVAPAGGDLLEADRQASVLRNLLDEGDLGGAFKLLVQVRG
jgi:SAM-dependent MidA family methyltransferase